MTQPLTKEQIADLVSRLEEQVEIGKSGMYQNPVKISECQKVITQLIATLEARDTAFEEMLAALKLSDDLVFAPMRNRKLVMDEHRHTVDETIRSAIAQAEKVK